MKGALADERGPLDICLRTDRVCTSAARHSDVLVVGAGRTRSAHSVRLCAALCHKVFIVATGGARLRRGSSGGEQRLRWRAATGMASSDWDG